jgi:hypothetical protein
MKCGTAHCIGKELLHLSIDSFLFFHNFLQQLYHEKFAKNPQPQLLAAYSLQRFCQQLCPDEDVEDQPGPSEKPNLIAILMTILQNLAI